LDMLFTIHLAAKIATNRLGHGKRMVGKGFAGEITRAHIHKAMRDGLKCLVIECDPNQEASKKIALKNGFSYSGRLNNLDVYRLTL